MTKRLSMLVWLLVGPPFDPEKYYEVQVMMDCHDYCQNGHVL